MQSKLFIALASAATVFASVLPRDDGFSYPPGVTVTQYPDGLPEDIKPVTADNGTEVAKREPGSIAKRANAGVYLCTDRNFSGKCAHIVAPTDVCVGLGPDLNDKVSSVGPDKPAYCLFYSNTNCNDNEGHFGTFSPGYSDLSSAGDPGPYWNDRISSYVCYNN